MTAGSSSIEVPVSYPCAFCDYLAGRRPYTVLARSSLVAVLVTREQRGLSHLLVVPVRHAPTILDVTDQESDALMRGVREAARAIDIAVTPAGIAVWQNNGVPAAQKIPHVHFHVAGTVPDGGTNWGDVEESSLVDTDAIASRLKQATPLDLR